MKLAEKNKARQLRRAGHSIGSITKKLNLAKSSVSLWVRDIELTSAQVKKLKSNPYSAVAVEKRRNARLKNENARRAKITDAAISQIDSLSESELFFVGVALYWGEGTKRKRGTVEVTNSDPKIIQVAMRFLREICKVPEEKFRGHVYLHEHLSIKDAVKHWSKITGIPPSQFYKTTIQHNRKRLAKDTLKQGTFAISICNTELQLKILGWIEGTYQSVVNDVYSKS